MFWKYKCVIYKSLSQLLLFILWGFIEKPLQFVNYTSFPSLFTVFFPVLSSPVFLWSICCSCRLHRFHCRANIQWSDWHSRKSYWPSYRRRETGQREWKQKNKVLPLQFVSKEWKHTKEYSSIRFKMDSVIVLPHPFFSSILPLW